MFLRQFTVQRSGILEMPFDHLMQFSGHLLITGFLRLKHSWVWRYSRWRIRCSLILIPNPINTMKIFQEWGSSLTHYNHHLCLAFWIERDFATHLPSWLSWYFENLRNAWVCVSFSYLKKYFVVFGCFIHKCYIYIIYTLPSLLPTPYMSFSQIKILHTHSQDAHTHTQALPKCTHNTHTLPRWTQHTHTHTAKLRTHIHTHTLPSPFRYLYLGMNYLGWETLPGSSSLKKYDFPISQQLSIAYSCHVSVVPFEIFSICAGMPTDTVLVHVFFGSPCGLRFHGCNSLPYIEDTASQQTSSFVGTYNLSTPSSKMLSEP